MTIAFLETRGVGRKTVARAHEMKLDEPGGAAAMLEALGEVKDKHPHTRRPSLEALERGLERADDVLEQCADKGIRAITPGDETFPERLRAIPDAPPLLYYRGDLKSLHDSAAVAIVGTRSPTKFGQSCARRLGKVFAKRGFTVVSGLALGCDEAAHKGCLVAGGPTVAMLAHGLDRVHPRSNEELAADILANGGALFSEYPPGTPPKRSYFVDRNRLQSGASDGTIVVETGIKGGTMHTARFALEQERVLGCLRHPPGREGDHCAGNELLVRTEGAWPLSSDDEITAFVEAIVEAKGGSQLAPPASPPAGADTNGQLSIFPETDSASH
jgi:DNA processing protein